MVIRWQDRVVLEGYGSRLHLPFLTKTGTTKTAHTSGHTTHGYIDSPARPTPAHCIQPALHQIQGRSPRTPEAKTGYKRHQQLHHLHHISSLPSPHQRPQYGTRTASRIQECTSPYHLRS